MTTKLNARRCATPGCIRRSSSNDGLCRPCHPCWIPPVLPLAKPFGTGALPSEEYRAVHQRVVRERGRAAEQGCAHCGNPAEEWAYDHTDPAPLAGTTPRGWPAEYSADASRYLPLCRSCHSRFDARSQRVVVVDPELKPMTDIGDSE